VSVERIARAVAARVGGGPDFLDIVRPAIQERQEAGREYLRTYIAAVRWLYPKRIFGGKTR
jgi:hypothetical protein